MYGQNSHNMPIGLAMSFSSNPEALKVFLRMSNAEQDKIMLEAIESNNPRQIQKMVDSLSRGATHKHETK